MNVIITGASGLLGRAVMAEFKRNSWKVLGLAHTRAIGDLRAIDVTDFNAVASIVREFKPHAIIHCAAEKSVDKIELDVQAYFKLNVFASAQLAKLAAEIKAVFVFISTDYVFPGENPPYRENDPPSPVNGYGLTKMKAEKAVVKANSDSLILRIPVLYGGEEHLEESAVSSLINYILSHEQVEVPNFEIRYPSHTSDVAAVICQLVQRKLQDESIVNIVYHWCGSEPFTKHEMATVIAQTFGRSHNHMIPVNVPMAGIRRPQNCQLSCERLEVLGIGRHTRFVDGIQEFRKFLH